MTAQTKAAPEAPRLIKKFPAVLSSPGCDSDSTYWLRSGKTRRCRYESKSEGGLESGRKVTLPAWGRIGGTCTDGPSVNREDGQLWSRGGKAQALPLSNYKCPPPATTLIFELHTTVLMRDEEKDSYFPSQRVQKKHPNKVFCCPPASPRRRAHSCPKCSAALFPSSC